VAFLGAGFAALVAVFVWSIWLALHRPPGFESLQATDLMWALPFIAFPAVGIIILARRPGNRVGWVLFGIGIAIGVGLAATEIGRLLSVSHGAGGTLVFLAGDGGIRMGLALVAILLLVFPDGRLPAAGFRWVMRLLLGATALTVLATFLVAGRPDQGHMPVSPLAWIAAGPITTFIEGRPGLAAYSLVLLSCAAAPFIRYGRSSEQVRRQLKWVAWSSGIFAFAEVVTNGVALAPALPGWVRAALLVPPAVAGVAVAASIGIAVLRHRLYDIDAVVSRTLAYGALAALIVAAYLTLVVGAGAVIGSRSGSNLLLPILATALVALAFQPARARLERLADRIVFGTRATPYELLSRFSQRAAAEYPDEGALDRLARALGDGLGANAVNVVLAGKAGGPHHLAATWPTGSTTPSADWVVAVAPVVDAGEVIGELRIWRATPLSQTEERLLDDLAAQTSLLIRNVRVTAELRLRLHELRASRERLVAAQDDERRRIERNLHDGAQQQLIAIAGRLGLAEGRPLDPQTARLLAELKVEVASALDDLRGIGRGLYPPLLASQGLRPALAALARRAPLPVHMDASTDRFDRTLEGAVYFCVSEGLQNACRHSGATSVDITVVSAGARVSFSVRDNGRGIKQDGAVPGDWSVGGLQNMRDRMAAVGGALNVTSSDSGTEVSGWCPKQISESVNRAVDERT
jgi:signal transduction histidine kinase